KVNRPTWFLCLPFSQVPQEPVMCPSSAHPPLYHPLVPQVPQARPELALAEAAAELVLLSYRSPQTSK
ncbi:MAG TPA: hypothetical protein VFY96_13065, partial [Candidatus Binatia bacterium]|nr:hypothetical protein [Candidatus Binatia bacterium]